MKRKLIDELIQDRDWRFSELEFCKKTPKIYTNTMFINHLDKHWRMCIPIIYAHFEGFVISSYQRLIEYLNKLKLNYSQVQPFIILLSNKHRFGYLQGKCSKEQQKRFLAEYINEEKNGIKMSSAIVSAKSNLNYKQFVAILDDFGIITTPQHNCHKATIDKLVAYRNKIAHGENSVVVYESDVNEMIKCVMEMIDITINDINSYVTNEPYLFS